MSKPKTNSQLVHVWAQQNEKDGVCGNMSFSGKWLFSYRTAIAYHAGGYVLKSIDSMSSTTAKQLSLIHRAVTCRVIPFPLFKRRYYKPFDFSPSLVVETLTAHRDDEVKVLASKRASRSMYYQLDVIDRIQGDIDHVCNYHSLSSVPAVNLTIYYEKIQEYKAKETEREKTKEQRQRLKLEKQRKQDAIQFEQWINGESVSFPSAYDRFQGSDLLTVRGDRVITSRGAQCPLKDVLKAIEFYQLRRFPYKTNGHKIVLGSFVLDSIDEGGNVRAGCHYFTAKEITNFIERWVK